MINLQVLPYPCHTAAEIVWLVPDLLSSSSGAREVYSSQVHMLSLFLIKCIVPAPEFVYSRSTLYSLVYDSDAVGVGFLFRCS